MITERIRKKGQKKSIPLPSNENFNPIKIAEKIKLDETSKKQSEEKVKLTKKKRGRPKKAKTEGKEVKKRGPKSLLSRKVVKDIKEIANLLSKKERSPETQVEIIETPSSFVVHYGRFGDKPQVLTITKKNVYIVGSKGWDVVPGFSKLTNEERLKKAYLWINNKIKN